MKRYRKYIVAGALFLFGVLWYRITGVSWMHEVGHVVFSLFTGGTGYVASGTLAYTSNGNILVWVGGAGFCMLFTIPVLLISVKKDALWAAAFFFGKAHAEMFIFFNSGDQNGARISSGIWAVVIFIYMFFTWGTAIALYLKYHGQKKRVDKKQNRIYNVA